MNAIEHIDEMARHESADGTVPMSLTYAGEILDQFRETKDPALGAKKWQVIDAFVKAAPYMTEASRSVLYNACFQFAWQTQDDYRQTQYGIRDRLIDPVFNILRHRDPPPSKARPQRVAVVSAQTQVAGPYANTRNLYSYVLGRSDRFEWSWYNYGPAEKELLEQMKLDGIRVRDAGAYKWQVDAVDDYIGTDAIDVVISDMYWYVPLALYARRPAPLWLHWSPGFQKMPADAVLLPDTQEPFDERCVTIPYVLDARYLKREATLAPKPGPYVFATTTRHAKVSEPFRDAVSAILDRHPNAVYALYGAGPLKSWHPRVCVFGAVDVHAVLPNVDVFLDTWPLCGCMAVMEAQAYGVPVVTLSQPATASYDRFKGGVVSTVEEYHALADAIVAGPGRFNVVAKGHHGNAKLTDVTAGAAAVERAIDDLWPSRPIQN